MMFSHTAENVASAFRLYAKQYAYDPAPLESASEVVATDETRWRTEKVSVAAAYGNERVPALLFLATHVETPYQTDARMVTTWPADTPTYGEWSIRQIQDAMRALDYLESRPDVDHDALAYTADSWGGERAPPILALDDRLKTAVLVSGGIAGGAFFSAVVMVLRPTIREKSRARRSRGSMPTSVPSISQ